MSDSSNKLKSLIVALAVCAAWVAASAQTPAVQSPAVVAPAPGPAFHAQRRRPGSIAGTVLSLSGEGGRPGRAPFYRATTPTASPHPSAPAAGSADRPFGQLYGQGARVVDPASEAVALYRPAGSVAAYAAGPVLAATPEGAVANEGAAAPLPEAPGSPRRRPAKARPVAAGSVTVCRTNDRSPRCGSSSSKTSRRWPTWWPRR